MENRSNIQDELREIAPVVADHGRNNPYTVPMGYFASLSDEIVSRIRITIPSKDIYSIPKGYFDGLAGSVMQKIKSQENLANHPETHLELAAIAPLLNSISKENVYMLPDNYFDLLEISVLKDQASGSIISMGSHIRKWITYAVAASVLFIVGATSFLYINKPLKNLDKNPSIEQRLAGINDADIISYLKDNEETPDDFMPASYEQEKEMQNMLKNASDEDIQNYLDESTDPGEKIIKGI